MGYSIKDISYEKNNVEFQIKNSDGTSMLCIETKGTDVEDLFAKQHRTKKEHETPIQQTWNYMGNIGSEYGVCTNYRHFVLITKQYGYSKYYRFDFNSIQNHEQKLKEFIGIFSKKRIIDDGFVEKLQTASIFEEQNFTKEFYKLYHETRLMMIKTFEEKKGVSKDAMIHYTQMFLNRLIFIFFVCDNGQVSENQLLTKRIAHVLESSQCTEHSKKVYDDIAELFVSFDKGSKILDIFGYNGGLFNEVIPGEIYFSDLKEKEFFADVRQYSELAKMEKVNKNVLKIINKHDSLNPIILNLILLDSFNFNSEVDVNILGHIFEQSISDIEQLKKESIYKRKKDGVYYTPEHITDYICRNTIIPYLSKSSATTVSDLIHEYEDDLEDLEKKLQEIRILDPACGSGAFLIKSANILREIYDEIQSLKVDEQHFNEQSQITQDWKGDSDILAFIDNNIFGVDINQESVEITKLSLFLKLATKERKLIDLSQRILQGNSLIDDETITPDAFSWNDKFTEVMNPKLNGGFDVVVGNPPYFNLSSKDILKNSKDYSRLSTGVLNVSSLFLKKGIDLLRDDGYLGFIIPKSFLTRNSWKPIREFVLDHSLIEVNDVGKQWKEVGLEQTIVLITKNHEQVKTKILSKFKPVNEIPQTFFKENGSILTGLNDKKLSLIMKIENGSIRLENISNMSRGVVINSSEYESEKQNSNFVHVLGGTNMERFLVKDGNKRKPNKFLNSDDLRIKKEIFNQRRIINQRVASSIPKIVATIEDKKLPTDDTINNIVLNDDNFSYEDIVAILNSDLMTFYLQYALINNSTLTIDLDRPYMGKIPIKNPKGSLSEIISNILKNKETIHNHNKKLFNRIQEQFPNVAISKKLESYYEMNFSEFIHELERLKAKIPLKQKDEWEDYFNEHSEHARKISDETKNDEEKINQKVFELYGLDENEVKIIQSALTS